MIRIVLVCSFLLNIQIAFCQDSSEFIKTEGLIKEIKMKASRRYVKEIATIAYTTNEGIELESYVELAKLPILGSFKNVGDKIEIYYDPNKPAYIETKTGSFINQYGMYILIILGIIFSAGPILKTFSKTKNY